MHARGRALQTMFKYSADQQAVISSRKKLEALAIKENARVIIQHEMQDFALLPRYPRFLD